MKKHSIDLVMMLVILMLSVSASHGDPNLAIVASWTFEDAHPLYVQYVDTGGGAVGYSSFEGDPCDLPGYAIPAPGGSMEYLESARLARGPDGQPTGTYGMHFYGEAGHYDPYFEDWLPGHSGALNGFADTPDAEDGIPTGHFDADFGETFTLAAYVRLENIGVSADPISIMGTYTGVILPREGMWVWSITAAGKMEFGTHFRVGDNHNAYGTEFTDDSVLSNGVVRHVAVRYDHGVVDFFVDGISVSRSHRDTAFPTSGWSTDTNWDGYPYKVCTWVGGLRSGYYSSFVGDMDNVMMSNRVLTDAEILDLAGGPQCGHAGYLPADLSENCYVNSEDLSMLVSQWLECTDPAISNCDQYWK